MNGNHRRIIQNIIFIANRTNYSSYLAVAVDVAVAVAVAPHYYNTA